MPTLSITSNEGQLDSASAVLELSATNPAYNQPVLRIKQAGGQARLDQIDDPNPDIEFVETGLASTEAGAGKLEIAVQHGPDQRPQKCGQPAERGFDSIVVSAAGRGWQYRIGSSKPVCLERLATGGAIAIATS